MFVDLRRIAVTAALFGLGVLGWSMLHDDASLVERATELACRARACDATLTKKTRDLFGWTFTFATRGERTFSVNVTCTRGFWVVGDYRCDVSEVDHASDSRFERQ
jgi:hypothetical protein